MNQELERYLNDHLAGSSGALLMIDHFIENAETQETRIFFKTLRHDIATDQEQLEQLLDLAGLETSTTKKVAGKITARVGMLKLMWEGFEPGKLGMFEALEMLAIGIQGKRLLWRALQEISQWYPEWDAVDFEALEDRAISQHDEVEDWRIEAAIDILPSVERRTEAAPVPMG